MFHHFLGYNNVNKQQKERKRAVWFCTGLSDLSVKLDCCVDSILSRGFLLGSLKHYYGSFAAGVVTTHVMSTTFFSEETHWSWFFKIRKLQGPVWFLIFKTVLILRPTINTLWRSFWKKKPTFPPSLSLRKELSLRALLWRHIGKHGAEIHCRLAWDKDLKSGSDQSLRRHYIFSSTSPHRTI